MNDLGVRPSLLRPRGFNEKIQWIKLNYRNPDMTRATDKVAARDFVAERIGSDHLIPLYGVWKRADEIDLDALPESFVLKSNWGSGHVRIVRDKQELAREWPAVRNELDRWMLPEANHYFHSYEWAYRDIPGRLLAEALLRTATEELPVDYKFFCFDGEPRLILAVSGRGRDQRNDHYTPTWERLPFTRYFPSSEMSLPRPSQLSAMLDIARELSRGFPHVRVDLYNEDDKVLFGELTFTPGNGVTPFDPPDWDRTLGDWFTLPRLSLRERAALYFER